MADLAVNEKYPNSYRLDHPDFGDVHKTTYAKGVIKEFKQLQDDPIEVQPLVKVQVEGQVSDFIPLFYHPKAQYWDDETHKATDFNQQGKYFEKAWMSFRGDDEVCVLLREGQPFAVLGFADGRPRIGEDVVKTIDPGRSTKWLQASKRADYGGEDVGPDGKDLRLTEDTLQAQTGEKEFISSQQWHVFNVSGAATGPGYSWGLWPEGASDAWCYGGKLVGEDCSIYQCSQQCIDETIAYCQQNGLSYDWKVTSDAYYLSYSANINYKTAIVQVRAVIIGPILYAFYTLWLKTRAYVKEQHGYFGETGIWVDYPNNHIYSVLDPIYGPMIGQYYDHDPGITPPPNLPYNYENNGQYNDYGGDYMCCHAGQYSKELLDKILKLEGIDPQAAYNRAINGQVDFVGPIEGLNLQTYLTAHGDKFVPYRHDPNQGQMLVRPHNP